MAWGEEVVGKALEEDTPHNDDSWEEEGMDIHLVAHDAWAVDKHEDDEVDNVDRIHRMEVEVHKDVPLDVGSDPPVDMMDTPMYRTPRDDWHFSHLTFGALIS